MIDINNTTFQETINNGVITWHERPIYPQCTPDLNINFNLNYKPAIIIQGPLIKDFNFTYETILMYKSIHKNSLIILSTWADEENNDLLKFKNLGIEVVVSQKPSFAGQQNANYQIVSSRNGLQLAHSMGATHALKTRTDQRLYSPNVLDYLFNILNLFPLKSESLQKERLIASSLNTFKYRMYGISDMLIFGNINDVLLYWSPKLDDRIFDPNISYFKNLREFSEWRVCEVYYCTEFLLSTDWKLEWTLKDYWKAISDRFCIVDQASLDILWPKYSNKEFRWLNYDLKSSNFSELYFKDWVCLYNGFSSITDIPEYRLG